LARTWPEWSDDDELAWELALRRDVDGLRARAAQLGDTYAAGRAAAFELAARGAEADAVRALSLRDAAGGPFPVLLALDLARIRFLAGHPDGALVALQVGLRGAAHVPPSARRLLAACVRVAPWSWRSALRIVFSAGTAWDRTAGAAAVVVARLSRNGT
jgi:hypothetical protein